MQCFVLEAIFLLQCCFINFINALFVVLRLVPSGWARLKGTGQREYCKTVSKLIILSCLALIAHSAPMVSIHLNDFSLPFFFIATFLPEFSNRAFSWSLTGSWIFSLIDSIRF